jgi:hypothetical protein
MSQSKPPTSKRFAPLYWEFQKMSQSDLPRPWATAIDSQGTVWPLRVDLAKALSLRQQRKLDLLGTDAAKTASEAASDPLVLAEVGFILTAPQRAARNPPLVEESDWLALFDGDTFQEMFDAVMESIIDFIRPDQREALRLVWTRQKEQGKRAAKQINQRIADPQTLNKIDKQADEALEEFERRMAAIGPMIRS